MANSVTLSNFQAQEVEQNNETKRRGHKETGSLVDSEISRPRKDIRSFSVSLSVSSLSLPLSFPPGSLPSVHATNLRFLSVSPSAPPVVTMRMPRAHLALEKLTYANEFRPRSVAFVIVSRLELYYWRSSFPIRIYAFVVQTGREYLEFPGNNGYQDRYKRTFNYKILNFP